MGTAQAGAVAIVCAARRGLPVALHTPSEVKAAVTGSGRADKDQVTAMVTRILRMAAPPRPADAADALALAICHLWRVPAIRARQARQTAGNPLTGKPVARPPLAADPVIGHPVAGDPVAGHPVARDPMVGDPVVGGPVVGDWA
jgi:crossover junction endodeoxyribonuclease RuvC